MGTVTNPLGSLLNGLVTGYGLSHQIKQQAMQEEAFQRQKAMQDEESSIKDIQNRMMLAQNAQPVNSGVVQNSALRAPASDVPGAPGGEEIPGTNFVRKSDPSRTVKYKGPNGTQEYELFTPEEQLKRQLDQMQSTAVGEGVAKARAGQQVRRQMLTDAGGGEDVPDDIASVLHMQGQKVLPSEMPGLAEQAATLRGKNRVTVKPGEDVVDLSTPGASGKPNVVASGGAPLPTDDFGKYFLPAYAQSKGKDPNKLTLAEVTEAREQFTGEKNPTEASLAFQAAKGNKLAEAALTRLDKSKRDARPINQFIAPQNAPQGPATIDQVPENIRGQVKQIMEYRSPQPSTSRSNPTNQAINYWLPKVAPGYDVTKFSARNKMMTSFTSGQQSKEIGGIVTALGHVGVLGDAIDALNNGNIQVLNSFANKFGVQVGKDPVTTFNAIVHKVAPELNRAYVGGVGSQGEIKDQASDFEAKMGDQQLRSNVGITAKLLRSKIGSLENQWKQTMGSDDFDQRFMTPEAQAALDKWSPHSGGGGGALAAGTVQDGYRFKGGDPSKPDSWEKVQ